MGYIAEVQVSHDDLVLMPTIRVLDDVTLRWEVNTTGEGSMLFFSAFGDLSVSLQHILEADHTIEEPVHIVSMPDRSIYRVRFVSDLVPFPTDCIEHGIFVFKVTSANAGWTVRLYLPDRDDLIAFHDDCADRDIAFRVDRLYDAETIDDYITAGLSEGQRDLLLTALYSGYYDVPRRASQSYLAEQYEVSPSAISQRLRRAVAQLIISALEPEDMNMAVDE